MSPEFEKQILVAGVGNAWMLDDGFGSVVAQRLEAREMPSGVRVMDAGSGGLDLAYEGMRNSSASCQQRACNARWEGSFRSYLRNARVLLYFGHRE